MQKSFLLFLALSFIQCKTENYPITGTITLPFKTGEKYLSVTESDYQYSYHFIPLETKEESLLSKIFCIKRAVPPFPLPYTQRAVDALTFHTGVRNRVFISQG